MNEDGICKAIYLYLRAHSEGSRNVWHLKVENESNITGKKKIVEGTDE